jgi:hypothetical protein
MDPAWKARREQWGRFEAWEAELLRTRPPDFSDALRWVAGAWELAARYDPEWGSPTAREGHWRHLAEVQAALARLRRTG